MTKIASIWFELELIIIILSSFSQCFFLSLHLGPHIADYCGIHVIYTRIVVAAIFVKAQQHSCGDDSSIRNHTYISEQQAGVQTEGKIHGLGDYLHATLSSCI